jgi:hypothetical protein
LRRCAILDIGGGLCYHLTAFENARLDVTGRARRANHDKNRFSFQVDIGRFDGDGVFALRHVVCCRYVRRGTNKFQGEKDHGSLKEMIQDELHVAIAVGSHK